MHLAVERNILDHFAAIGLEGGAEVVNVNAGQLGHHPVGAARGKAPHDKIVNALFAPAGHHIVSLFQLFQEVGNLAGIVLQVAVHGQDELARGVVKTCGQSRGLSEVAAQLDHQHAAVHRGNLFQQLVGAVVGPVINQHQLKTVAHLLHHLFQARIQNRHIFFFIMKWDDN